MDIFRRLANGKRVSALAAALVKGCVLLASTPALSLSSFTELPGLRQLPGAEAGWDVHPFSTTGLSLVSSAQRALVRGASLDDAVIEAFRATGRAPFLGIRSIPESSSQLDRSAGTLRRLYSLTHAGRLLCGDGMRATRLADGDLMILGSLPRIDAVSLLGEDAWPSADEAIGELLSELGHHADGETLRAENVKITAALACWQPDAGTLLPAWRVQLTADGLPYEGVADATRVFRLVERYLPVAVTGKARVYPQNSQTGSLVETELRGLIGDGTLTGELWRISVPDDGVKAVAANHVFNYEPTDKKFAQPSVYAHVQAHYDYFKSIGYEWPSGRTLNVSLHVNTASMIDNGLYIPADENTSQGDIGEIRLGDGSGKALQNLALDADVVSHEFGHQVVYQTLKETARCSEAIPVHEGLADFFVFARTGDPCLGETICVPNPQSQICISTQCLRTADLPDFKYRDTNWYAWSKDESCFTHLNGQIFTAMLWDVYKKDGIALNDLARLVLRATQFFKRDSGLRDLLLALLLSDKELFAGKNRNVLLNAMVRRGLNLLVSDVGATGDIPTPTGNGATSTDNILDPTQTPTKSSSSSSSKKKKNIFGCGIQAENGDSDAAWLFALGVLLPLLWVVIKGEGGAVLAVKRVKVGRGPRRKKGSFAPTRHD